MTLALTDEEKLALRRDTNIFTSVASTPLDQILADLQTQIDAVPINDSVLTAKILDGAVTAAKLADALLGLLLVANWGTPAAEASNAIEVTLQVQDVAGNDVAGEFVLEVQVADTEYGDDSSTATLTDAGTPNGTILDGDGTAVVRVKTAADGSATLSVGETAAASRFLHARPCAGSPMIDCREVCELTFV